MTVEDRTAGESPRVKVVHVVLSLEVGGLEMVVLNLVRLADRSAFDHAVVCLHGRGGLAPRFEALDIPVLALEAEDRWQFLRRLVTAFRSLRPHLVHTHNPAPHLFGALAAKLTGVPAVVHTKHGRNFPGVPRLVLANRVASLLSDAVVAVSEDAARVARDTERVPASRVRVFPNGVDLARWPVQDSPGPSGPPRAVCVARLDPVKDHASLFRAARLVRDAEPAFRLDVIGDGDERPRLEALVRELGLEEAVTFRGHRDDVESALAGADVFVLASTTEGISLTLLEAMAAALPIVATDVGGNREVVVSGETGWLVPPRSPEALADALLAAIRDREQERRFGAAGRRRVEALFDLRVMVRRYESLYREVLAAKGVVSSPRAGLTKDEGRSG
jgi:sugar transferase (PEP-CTERM/EpsH1 system associated)